QVGGGNGSTRGSTEPLAVDAPPEEDVRVQEQRHRFLPAKPANTSGGSGASKSAAMRMRPLEPPGVRTRVLIATRRARGTPAFAITISSPAAACSTRADR